MVNDMNKNKDKNKDKISVKRPEGLVLDSTLVVLTLVAPGGANSIFRVHKKRVVIGSVESADIRLSGDGVAPIHAVLEVAKNDKGVSVGTIYDLASDTGVFVNGAKVITQALKVGDELTIGRMKLKFSLADANEVAARENSRTSLESRKLFMNSKEDLKSLLLEDEREVNEIFDYSDVNRSCLEVVMSWKNTILQVEHFVDEKQITIGNLRDNDFGIPPILSSAWFPLVTSSGGSFVLNLDPKMRGVMQQYGRLVKLEEISSEPLPLNHDEFAKISVGQIDFYLSVTTAPPKAKLPKTFDRDPLFFKVFTASMVFTVVMIASMLNAKVPQIIEAEQLPDRIATVLYQPEKYVYKKKEPQAPAPKAVETAPKEEVKTPPKVTKLDIKPNANPKPKNVPKIIETGTKTQKQSAKRGQNEAKEGAGARAKGKEGQRGSPKAAPGAEAQNKAKRPSPEGGQGNGGGHGQVQGIGNVDLLKDAGSKVQSLLGTTSMKLGKGGEKLQGFGGFTTLGRGGLALSGDGKGGGGNADTLGGLANKGVGGGRVGTGFGAAGNGAGIIGGKTRVVIRSGGPEEAVVMGAIDADAVEAALLAHKDEFRRCYETEINAETPNLAGRVGTSFVIGSSGRVTQTGIESTTLKHAGVERCLLKVIQRIDFPIPRGGGIVQVTYPFKFSSGR